MISMTGHLDVVVPPTIIDEESSPSTVSVREKHNASLICKSHGVCSLPLSHQNKRTSHDLKRTESKGVYTIRCLNQTSPGEERTVDRSSETRTRRSRGRWRALCTGGNTLICRLKPEHAFIIFGITSKQVGWSKCLTSRSISSSFSSSLPPSSSSTSPSPSSSSPPSPSS